MQRKLRVEKLEDRRLLAFGSSPGVGDITETIFDDPRGDLAEVLPVGVPLDVIALVQDLQLEAWHLSGGIGPVRFAKRAWIVLFDLSTDTGECGLEGPCGAFTERMIQRVRALNMVPNFGEVKVEAWVLAKQKFGAVQNVIKVSFTDDVQPESNFEVYIDNTMLGGSDNIITGPEFGRWLDNAWMAMSHQDIIPPTPDALPAGLVDAALPTMTSGGFLA